MKATIIARGTIISMKEKNKLLNIESIMFYLHSFLVYPHTIPSHPNPSSPH